MTKVKKCETMLKESIEDINDSIQSCVLIELSIDQPRLKCSSITFVNDSNGREWTQLVNIKQDLF